MPIHSSRVVPFSGFSCKEKVSEQAVISGDSITVVASPINYLPAQVKKIKNDIYIEYYCMNPATLKMARKRLRMNKLRKKYGTLHEFKLYANMICSKINSRLASGWNPYFQSEDARLYVPLRKVCDEYIAEKRKELRPDSIRVYSSFCKLLMEWVESTAPGVYCSMFGRSLAVQYMDYIYKKKARSGCGEVGARTYNNNLKEARALFAWAKEKLYCRENPFDAIKTKREAEKKRILVEIDYRSEIGVYLEKENPFFLLSCMLVFNSLLRPKEIRMIKVKDVDLEGRCIFVPAENAKNHHGRFAPLNDEIVELMRRLGVADAKPEYYLQGAAWRPGVIPMPEHRLRKSWNKLRERLHLPKDMQLYSLRDSGINGMLKAGIDPLSVMQAADHHDLAMTTRYANHRDAHLIDLIADKSPKF